MTHRNLSPIFSLLLLFIGVFSAFSQKLEIFSQPGKSYYPETWFHYISGNVAKEGITADLEAISGAGISGVHLFHGHFTDDVWPGVENPVKCLGPLWNDALRHTALESERLGLKFTMQNCPGWAMSGGPWIEPENAMRNIVMSKVSVNTRGIKELELSVPVDAEDWCDYRDIAVLAFPTPLGENETLPAFKVISDDSTIPWEEWLKTDSWKGITLRASSSGAPHSVDLVFDSPVSLRSLELPCVQSMSHHDCYEPDVHVKVLSVDNQGINHILLDADLPQSSWQDYQLMTLAMSEFASRKYRIEISNGHDISFNHLKVSQTARKNNWESEAGRTLRAIERCASNPKQSVAAYINSSLIVDITDKMDSSGRLRWNIPDGNWTIMRFGHQNAGMRNSPAPPEGTGWECDKLSKNASSVHFNGYIGRLSENGGPIGDGLLKGMIIDSWECQNQTWTPAMEKEFEKSSGYKLRRWLPALFGYVIGDHETTTRFLRDWRRTVNGLIVDNYYGNMASLARNRGLTIGYETAIGDVVVGDILEFYKYADEPMCEFWQPVTENFVGSANFKPIKPTASAARMYGKPRVTAEAFTSFSHTWDETLSMLKDVANKNMIDGVSHLVFHTYTHNPQVDFLPPGTSFGGQNIGSPFLRGQTWWPYMHLFTDYLSRCCYMLEEGVPVSDVLWYLGDEMDHKPDQNASFPKGFKYDYCNPDALLNRLAVDKNGNIVTPEGISYKILWIPENERMLPSTLKKIYEMIKSGATVVANPPVSPATLSGGSRTVKEFNKYVKLIWGEKNRWDERLIGKGRVYSGFNLDSALEICGLKPDVVSDCGGVEILWNHRRSGLKDWYFVASPVNKGIKGEVKFNCTGYPQVWNPVDGKVTTPEYRQEGGETIMTIDMPVGGSCFVMFDSRTKEYPESYSGHSPVNEELLLDNDWRVSFPEGWGIREEVCLESLKPWCEIENLSDEGKAFSGTATYVKEFELNENVVDGGSYILDLGEVAHIAEVELNGEKVGTVWCAPYRMDIGDKLRIGKNRMVIKVTGTWYNRLAYDSKLPSEKRKTWAIRHPDGNQPLRPSGLLGPVRILF